MDAAGRARAGPEGLARPRLPLAQYRLVFAAREAVRLPAYTGSMWRGSFGHALKQAVCVTREKHCPACLLYSTCVYSYIFETPPVEGISDIALKASAPHPFSLDVPASQAGVLKAGDAAEVGLSLFGRANAHLPYVIHAFQQVGESGVGAGRGRLSLRRVEQLVAPGGADWRTVYEPGGQLDVAAPLVPETPDCPSRCIVRIHTPVRMKQQGRNLTPANISFGALFKNLLRRTSLLISYHTSERLQTDFSGLARASERIPFVASGLEWKDWTRYSSRQDTAMQMGGVVGWFEVDLQGQEALWPYLWLGQWLHAGKATSMGLGRYTIEMPTSLRPQPETGQ